MKKNLHLTFLVFLLSSCLKTYNTSGHLFEKKEIDILKEAKTKNDILEILGTPTTISNFGQETWYYITVKKSKLAFLPEKVVNQNVVVVEFKSDENISKIDYLNETNNSALTLVKEYTPSKGTETSSTHKIFKNLGKFSNIKKNKSEIPRGGF